MCRLFLFFQSYFTPYAFYQAVISLRLSVGGADENVLDFFSNFLHSDEDFIRWSSNLRYPDGQLTTVS